MTIRLRVSIGSLLRSSRQSITHHARRSLRWSAAALVHFTTRTRATLYTWIRGFWNDVVGPRGYRGLAVIVAGYVGFFSIIEARHDRQLNFATTERNVFITIVSSGERGSFIAGMKTFGPTQTVSVFDEPSLFEAWNWRKETQPNLEPLYSWALYRLPLCTPEECGQPHGYRIDLQDADLNYSKLERIDLHDSDLRFARMNFSNLFSANLNRANLACASLIGSDLRNAELEGAILKLTYLVGADLEGANLRNAHIEGHNPLAFLINRTFVADGKVRSSTSQGVPFELTPCGLTKADGLTGAEFKHVDLRGVTGLHCGLLTKAHNWHLACRDPEFACGEEIPEPGSQFCPIIDSQGVQAEDGRTEG